MRRRWRRMRNEEIKESHMAMSKARAFHPHPCMCNSCMCLSRGRASRCRCRRLRRCRQLLQILQEQLGRYDVRPTQRDFPIRILFDHFICTSHLRVGHPTEHKDEQSWPRAHRAPLLATSTPLAITCRHGRRSGRCTLCGATTWQRWIVLRVQLLLYCVLYNTRIGTSVLLVNYDFFDREKLYQKVRINNLNTKSA